MRLKKAIGRIYEFDNDRGPNRYFANVSLYNARGEEFNTRTYSTRARAKRRANVMAKKLGWTIEWKGE